MMLVPLAISLLLAMPQDLDPDPGSSPNPSSQSYSSSWVLVPSSGSQGRSHFCLFSTWVNTTAL